jgi:hypothetical protein
LKAKTGLSLIYDDNVWQFSDRDRSSFENSQNSSFFQNVESLDDFIWEPYFFLQFQPLEKTPSTQLFADISGNFYVHNPSLNLGIYQIGLKQEIRHKVQAAISYTLIPREFVGISRENPSSSISVGETITTHTTRFRIERKIRDINLGLTVHHKFKDYNDTFEEQDNNIYGAGLESKIYSGYGLKTRIAYLFELGVASGRNNTNFNNDLSYRSHQLRISPEVRINRDLTIGVRYEIKYKAFTTNLSGDTNHYGRYDTTHTVGANIYYELGKTLETKLGYERVMKRPNKNKDFFAFDENVAIVGLSYLF